MPIPQNVMVTIQGLMDDIVAKQRRYTAVLWEFGQSIAELEKRGLPTVLGTKAAAAKKMFAKFNSAEDASSALPVPEIVEDMPNLDMVSTCLQPYAAYLAKLEEFLGPELIGDMKSRLLIIQAIVQINSE